MPQDLRLDSRGWLWLNRCLGSLPWWGHLSSRSPSLTVPRVSSWVGAEIHTMAILSTITTKIFLPSCRWSTWRWCILHSLFIVGLGMHPWPCTRLMERLSIWVITLYSSSRCGSSGVTGGAGGGCGGCSLMRGCISLFPKPDWN